MYRLPPSSTGHHDTARTNRAHAESGVGLVELIISITLTAVLLTAVVTTMS